MGWVILGNLIKLPMRIETVCNLSKFTVSFGCPTNHFLCKNSKCLAPLYKCDGKNDCGDNSDENEGCAGNRNNEGPINKYLHL